MVTASRFEPTLPRLPVVNELRSRFRATSATSREKIQLRPKNGGCKPAGLSPKRSELGSLSLNSVAPCEDNRVRELICWRKAGSKNTFRNCAAESRIDSHQKQPQIPRFARDDNGVRRTQHQAFVRSLNRIR